MRISDWSSDVCSSDLAFLLLQRNATAFADTARTFNQRALATTFDQVQAAGPQPLLGVIDAFAAASVAQVGAGLDAVSGDAAAQGAALRLGWEQRHFERMLDRLRSEEHTSELQSLMRISYAVFCLKKKKYILTDI